MAGAQPTMEVDGLGVDYWDGRRWVSAVDNVSFSIAPGEILGLAGESGCGKSTVAYALLAERRPGSRFRSGRVLFEGQDLLQASEPTLRALRGARVSFVPQNPTTSLTPSMKVGRQVAEVLRFHGVARGPAASRRAVELLEAMGLPEPARSAAKYPHQLSGGQQQRVVIAMALACSPALVVLDEPTTGLDVTTQQRILALLADLRRRVGSAMLYVSHDLGALSQICDRMAVMYAGNLVEVAPVEAFFHQPRHPYARGLIASLPRIDVPPNPRVALRGILDRSRLPAGCRFTLRCDYATPDCADMAQSLEPVAPGHTVACWRWRDIAAEPGTAPIPAIPA